MGDEDNKPRGILSFALADGTPWAEMRVLGLDDEDEPEEDLSPEFKAHFVAGNDRLH